MAKEDLEITIPITENVAEFLKSGYEEYLEKASEEDVLTVEEYYFHILKLGILTNEIDKEEIKLSNNKSEQTNIKLRLGSFKNQYESNRKKLYNKYSFE